MTAASATNTATTEPGLRLELSDAQRTERERFRRFVDEHVAPEAGRWDREANLPREVIDALRQEGLLGAILPAEVGGGGMDHVTYGLLTEEIGRGCSSVRSLLTVHDMVTRVFSRRGQVELRAELLESMARGERIAALALSEPGVGSDAANVETETRREGDDWVIDGTKKWITFGQIADLYLVSAKSEKGTTAFLVPWGTPGFERRPVEVVGTRASMVAQLEFTGCRIPDRHRVGPDGRGFAHVVTAALDHGRYSVAWGAVGIARACLEASMDYARSRHQGGGPIFDHQLIQRRLTEMIAGVRAARLVCCRAGTLRDDEAPEAMGETMLAKYVASRAATEAANSAVQLHGANGLSPEYPVERYLRDARVTEIIEGSTEIQQTTIPKLLLGDL